VLYGVTPINKLQLEKSARILRQQELKQQWSERRLELVVETRRTIRKCR